MVLKKYVPLRKKKTDVVKRLLTLQCTVKAEHSQNTPLIIIFKGKPAEEDPRIPVSGILKKEIPDYDDRGSYVEH